jgi:hypothetical protein
MTIAIHPWGCGRVRVLVVLCAVVPGVWAQPNAERAGGHRHAAREPEAIEPRLVNSDQGLSILGAALESRHTDANADCSNLVHEIYERAGFRYSYANSSELYLGIKEFRRVMHPQAGDLVVWRGHVGIVISPLQHSFFSAMRSGRGVEFYDSPYWQQRGQSRFFRYIKPASRIEFSATIQETNLKAGSSRSAESREQVFADGKLSPVPGASSVGHASGMTGANAVVSAENGRANPTAALPATDAAQGTSLHNSEVPATRDAQGAMEENKPRPTVHHIQSLEDGVWETAASKPSAGIPFDSAATVKQPSIPRSQASNALNADARPRFVGKPPAHESRPQATQWAMSRYVPRPPWSLPSQRTVPRQSPTQFPRATAAPTWQ